MLRKILAALSVLLMLALFYVGLALSSDGESIMPDPPLSLPAVGTVRAVDHQALVHVFGCDIPYAALAGSGSVYDASVGTLTARVLEWQGDDGLLIRAVRPAEAAQLLRSGTPDIRNSTRWAMNGDTLLSVPGKDGATAYYQDAELACSFYLEGADERALVSTISSSVTFPAHNEQ